MLKKRSNSGWWDIVGDGSGDLMTESNQKVMNESERDLMKWYRYARVLDVV